jgi:hypothetical protein
MSNMDTDTIYAAASFIDAPLPKPVTEAHAVLDAAEALRDSIATETQPELGTLSRKNLNKLHATMVAYENREARLRAAEQIVHIATQALAETQFTNQQLLAAPLAAAFNDAADRFTKAYGDLEGNVDQLAALSNPARSDAWRRLSEAASQLDYLSKHATPTHPKAVAPTWATPGSRSSPARPSSPTATSSAGPHAVPASRSGAT